MLNVTTFTQQRVEDLRSAQHVLLYAWKHKTLPALTDISTGCIATPIATALLLNLLVVLLTPHGRRRTWELVEAVLASLLMFCLLLAVLGMPIGTR